MSSKNYYIIDFDSTFTQVEALDELAAICLHQHADKAAILAQIEDYTHQAMEGRLAFSESLARRIALLNANQEHLQKLISKLKKKISVSFSRNALFFKRHASEVLIVSGGFKEFIEPVLRPYHIKAENIYANTFITDDTGRITGYDQGNPLSEEGGKVKLIRQLDLKGNLYGIGDGYSDYQLRESGLIKKFYAFTENIARQSILPKADHITPSFDEFLYVNDLPRAISYPRNRILCLLIGDVPEESQRLLKKDGFSIRHKNTFEEKYIADVGMLILADGQTIAPSILKKAAKLKVIGYLGSAKSHLPTALCTEMGIVVFDDPKQNPRNARFISKRVSDFINNGSTYLSLNFPSLQLPKIEKSHRLIHIHKNVPGIMAQINTLFSRHDININGQFLMTNSQIGYVITDIDTTYDKHVLKSLKKIDHTIKFRVLY